MPTEQEKAALSKKRGAAAAQVQDPAQRQKFVAAQGNAEAKGNADYGKLDREAEDTLATGGQNKAVQSYKKGGMVRKTGLARVHKGEFVAPRKYARAAAHMVGKAKRKGNSQKMVSKKIGVLRKEGVPQKQAVATAISMGKAGRITGSGGYRRVGKS